MTQKNSEQDIVHKRLSIRSDLADLFDEINKEHKDPNQEQTFKRIVVYYAAHHLSLNVPYRKYIDKGKPVNQEVLK